MNTVCAIGTGPSLTLEQVDVARSKGFRLFGANRVFQIVPDLEVMYAVNSAFWATYHGEAKGHSCQKWTTNKQAADAYGLNWIAERFGAGLCTEPGVIFHGHGSGYSLLGVAHKLGAERIVLLGYDMNYPQGYDGHQRTIGDGKRHYFGEYPTEMQHWPKNPWVDLIPLYRAIYEQAEMELVCCTPGSALEGVIPSMDIADVV